MTLPPAPSVPGADGARDAPSTRERPDAARSWRARDVVGVLLVGLGLVLWGLSVFVGSDDRSYSRAPHPPASVELRSGATYGIDLVGGVAEAQRSVIDTQDLACTITPVGGPARQLAVTSEATTTRAVHRIATFVSPVGGRVTISCTGLPAVYVDDAEDVGPDWSLLCIVLAAVTLAVGVPLTLSAVRQRIAAPPDGDADDAADDGGPGDGETAVR